MSSSSCDPGNRNHQLTQLPENMANIGSGTKAYISLRRKVPGVGGWRWAMPPTPEFCVGDTNMLVYFGIT